MLELDLPKMDFFDESTERFFTSKACRVQLEHSLLAVSKWEAKFEIPFQGPTPKTTEQTLAYVDFMFQSEYTPVRAYLVKELFLKEAQEYIGTSASATTFRETPGQGISREIVTSEMIYYWMTVHSIPFEAEKWHLNRLLSLIRIANIKAQPPKKQSRSAAAQQRHQLNAQRRAQTGSRG